MGLLNRFLGNDPSDATQDSSTGPKESEASKTQRGMLSGLFSRNKNTNRRKTVQSMDPDYQSFKRGGKVKRTGMAKVHRGERVLTRKQAKRYTNKKR